MELPKSPNSQSSQEQPTKKPPVKFPKPQELISHYESQGMNTPEASIKVIDDLQQMLFRVVTSRKGKKDNSMGQVSRKLDNVNARLAIVERKLDSKPGIPQSFALGVASVAAFNGVIAVWPQVASAVVSVWNSVRGSTNT